MFYKKKNTKTTKETNKMKRDYWRIRTSNKQRNTFDEMMYYVYTQTNMAKLIKSGEWLGKSENQNVS